MTAQSGLGLSQRFHATVVGPILMQHFPHLRYTAARIGLGSEVLGYDDEISADHDFSPSLQLFLTLPAFSEVAADFPGLKDFSASFGQRGSCILSTMKGANAHDDPRLVG